MKPFGYRKTPTAQSRAHPQPDPDLAEAVHCFDGFLAATGRAPGTRRLYCATVRDWLAAGGRPGHIDPGVLSAWLGERRGRLAPATLNRELKALRRFYAAMRLLGWCTVDVAHLIPRNRPVPKRLPRGYTDDQIGAILAQPDVTTFAGLRDHLILRVLYETGLRSSELAALGVPDILCDRTIYVSASAGLGRYAPISAETAAALERYIDLRATTRPGKRRALWVSVRGAPLRGGRSVWEIVSRHARAALGFGAAFEHISGARRQRPWSGHYPHRLRASMAAAMLQRGCPITAIAQILGHADVSTTESYLGMDLDVLRAAISMHPRASRVE